MSVRVCICECACVCRVCGRVGWPTPSRAGWPGVWLWNKRASACWHLGLSSGLLRLLSPEELAVGQERQLKVTHRAQSQADRPPSHTMEQFLSYRSNLRRSREIRLHEDGSLLSGPFIFRRKNFFFYRKCVIGNKRKHKLDHVEIENFHATKDTIRRVKGNFQNGENTGPFCLMGVNIQHT